ncbi:DUF2683 family protein [Brumimicrobium glaciale]|uniref:DUF2683 family protein n=1 Tax=Brumimicrobium glaciale TaxID=200475 RepID=UPI001A926F6E|nr:DUF2683 family protein [Brumimicrobium glaciale]
MKTNNPETKNKHLDNKYGKEGTVSRKEFEQKAEGDIYKPEFVEKILNSHKNDKRHTIPTKKLWENI